MNNNINLTKLVNKTKNITPYSANIITSDNYVKTEKIIADDGLLIYGNEKNITIHPNLNTGATGPILQIYGPGGQNSNIGIHLDTFKSPDNVIGGRYFNKNPAIEMIAVDNGKYTSDLYFKIAPSSNINNNLPSSRNVMKLSSDGSVYVYNNLFVQKDLVYQGTTTSNGDLIINGNTFLNGNTFTKNIFVDGKIEATELLIKEIATFEGDVDIYGNLIVESNLEVYLDTFIDNDLFVFGISNFNGDVNVNDIYINGDLYVDDLVLDNLIVNNNLTVGGNTDLENNLRVGGNTDLDNNLFVNGSSFFNDNSIFNNNIQINENLRVSGNTLLNNTLINGNVFIDGDTLDINAVTTITQDTFIDGDTLDINAVTTITQDTTINGDTLDINAVTTITQDTTIDGDTLNINAVTTITQDTTIDGDTLDINAVTTITQDTTIDANVVIGNNDGTNTLEVNSISTFNNNVFIDGDTLDINAVTTITQDTNIEGDNLYIDAITTIDQNTTINGDVIIDGNSLYINAITEVDQTATFNDDVYIGTVGTFLDVDAISTFYDDVEIYADSLYVDAESEFVLNTVFDENVNIVKNCFIDNSIIVGNTGYFGGNVAMGENLLISNSLIVGNTGFFGSNLQVRGNLTINGSSTFNSNCIFQEPISVNSTSSFIGVATFTELPLCSQIPSLSNQLVNKQYLDTIAAGLSPKQAAKVGTTTNITLSGNQTIDNYTTETGDRVLVMYQTDPIDNGIYISDPGPWSRASDYDVGNDVYGTLIFVQNGDVNINTAFIEYLSPAIVGTYALGYTTFANIFFDIGQGLEYVSSTTLQVKNNLNFVNNVGTVLSGNLDLGTTGFNTNIYSNLNVKGNSDFQNAANFQNALTVGLTATFNNNVIINGPTANFNSTTNNFSGTTNFNNTMNTQNIVVKANYNIEQLSGTGIITQSGTGTNSLKAISVSGTISATGITSLTDTTSSTSTSTGALVVSGGVGIGGSLNVAGNIQTNSAIRFNDGTEQNTSFTGAGNLAGTYTNVDMTIDTNGKITAISNGTSGSFVPTGSILPFGGTIPPAGYLVCDGGAYDRITYSALFAVIGTTYGVGNQKTTFNIPNLLDRFPIGSRTTSSIGVPDTSQGSGVNYITGGNRTITNNQMASHTHPITFNTTSYNFGANTSNNNTSTGGGADRVVSIEETNFPTQTGAQNSTQNDFLPKYCAVQYIIKY